MSPAPKVHVGPHAPEVVVEAVRRGGGEPAAAQGADAIVWLGDPDGLRAVLADGVRWVQLPSAGVEQWLEGGTVDDRLGGVGTHVDLRCVRHRAGGLPAG